MACDITKMTHKSVTLTMSYDDFQRLKRLAEKGLEAETAEMGKSIAIDQLKEERTLVASMQPANGKCRR